MAILLLHGLGRDREIMQPMANYLQTQTEEPIYNLAYPSRRFDFPKLLEILNTQLQAVYEDDGQPFHMIGHSMGGIMIRLLLQTWRPKHLGHVIQVGSPNQGTTVVDFLNKTGLFKLFYGQAASRLGTEQHSVLHDFKPVDYSLGVIAGSKVACKDLLFDKFVFTQTNDGLVAVQSTRVSEMRDFICLPENHVEIISSPETFEQVWHFLQHGAFIARSA